MSRVVSYISRIAAFLSIVALMLFVWSCDYRDIDEHWYESSEITLLSDWNDFPEEVTGMTVIFYPREEGRTPVRTSTNDVSRAKLYVPMGTYDVIIFNQSENEFGSLNFDGMDSFQTARAVLCEQSVTWAQEAIGQTVGSEPEWLGVAVLNDVTVTREMVDATYTIRRIDKEGGSEEERERAVALTTLSAKPRNVVFTGRINVKMSGTKYVKWMRGAISGMASSYYLGTGSVSSVPVCHSLDTWTVSKEQSDPLLATTHTVFRTFGLANHNNTTGKADGNDRTSNTLILSFGLVDGSTTSTFSFNVDDRIVQYPENLSIELNIGSDYSDPQDPGSDLDPCRAINIPEVEQSGGGSGFSVTVGDWGENEEVDVPMI